MNSVGTHTASAPPCKQAPGVIVPRVNLSRCEGERAITLVKV